MRKSVTVALLLTLVFSTFAQTFAQKASPEVGRGGRKVGTKFGSVRALSDGAGVVIRWEMSAELNTAGYNVYRVGAGSNEQVNRTMVVGSWGRSRDKLAFGEIYNVFDPDGEPGSAYVVEGQNIDGSRFSSKAVAAMFVKDMETETGTSTEAFRTASLSKNSNVERRTSQLTSELNDLVSQHQQEPDPENQKWVAAQPGAKIGVKKDGFYRIPSSQLQAANFNLNSDSTNWRLFLDGVEQAIIVPSGGQYIEFYGKGIDTPESDMRIYYLINGPVPGRRIGTRALRPIAGSAASTRYPVTYVKKERTAFFETLFNGDGENFLGGVFSVPLQPSDPPPIAVNFTLTGVDATVPNAEITVNLYGFSDNAHSVTPRINGHDLSPITQFGEVFFGGTATIPATHLLEGNNKLELTSGAPADYCVFDNLEVKYSRQYLADENRISFFTPGYKKVDVKGFSSENTRIFDMTFDGTPTLLANVPVVADGTSFTAKIPSSRTMVAYAVEDSGLLQAPSVTQNVPSTLSSTTNSADMLIISHSAPSFMAVAQEWATYRRSSAGGGFSVKVVDVVDTYDEFNYGVFGAAGIKSFLEYASTDWQTAPRYVLFIGDASYDHKNYEGWGNFDLVPSRIVTMIARESASDDALADFDDDGFAEMAVGRIPARMASSITVALNKTITFETPSNQTFARGALFAHDLPSGFDFENMNQQMAAELPPGTPVTMVSAGSPTAQADLVTAMNQGPLIVNFSGHGASGLWVNSNFFGLSTPSLLTNIDRPSIFNMLTCLNGYFIRPNANSISEVLLNAPNGGAVAAWASTAETTPDIQLLMGVRYFNQASSGPQTRMGDLVKDAKTVITFGADVRRSWVLLGDPALKVP
jgi:hypothetical protein